MRTPAHGRGKLRVGGTNRGGPGRPPSAVKASARQLLDDRLPTLAKLADDKKTRPADRIAAIGLLGKFGLDDSITVADVRAALGATAELIRARLDHEEAEAMISEIRELWMSI